MNPIRMYRLTIAVLFLSLAAVIYYYNSKEPVADPPVKEDPLCIDYSQETPSTLETAVIYDMVNEYRNKQLKSIDSTIATTDGGGDAHSVWFDLKTLKKFIFHIEHNVRTNKPNNTDELGLRFYYAAYPSDMARRDDLTDVDPTYMNRHTVVLIPTIFNKNVGHVDFNPVDTTTYNGYISQTKQLNSEIFPYQVANYTPMALTNNQRVVSKNHGSLIPPAPPIVEAF